MLCPFFLWMYNLIRILEQRIMEVQFLLWTKLYQEKAKIHKLPPQKNRSVAGEMGEFSLNQGRPKRFRDCKALTQIFSYILDE